MAGSKPTAEGASFMVTLNASDPCYSKEIAKLPNPPPPVTTPTATTTTNSNQGVLPVFNPYIRPTHPAYQFATYQPSSQPSNSTAMPYAGISQFRVMPPTSYPASTSGTASPAGGAATPSTPSWSGAYAYPAAMTTTGYLPYYSNGYYNAYMSHRATITGTTPSAAATTSASASNSGNATQPQIPTVSQAQPQGQPTPHPPPSVQVPLQPRPPPKPVSYAALQTPYTSYYLNRPFLPLAPQTVATMTNAQTKTPSGTSNDTNQ